MTCDRCLQPADVGEHGWMRCPLEPRRSAIHVIDDQLEGGARWCETLGHQPVWLDGTKSQWKREIEKHNVVCVGDRKPASYFAKHRKMQDECIRDTGVTLDGHRVRE